ncbi:MAG TPA: hypothetical protein VEY95_15550 [Azospirillaceae bacterium]|nr:hypothetical protein [Azospirillaceae bacterium]
MDERKPASPFADALRSDPKRNAREAKHLYDSPDRREVEAAQAEKRRRRRKGGGIGDDPVVTENVRKPF